MTDNEKDLNPIHSPSETVNLMDGIMTDQEINEAVARKLGWTYEKPPEVSYCAPMPWIDPAGKPHFSFLDYCHSIEAAWEILEFIIQDGKKQMRETRCSETPQFELRMGPVGVFHCDLGDSGEAGWYNTAPMAICLAFLKLEGEKVESQTMIRHLLH